MKNNPYIIAGSLIVVLALIFGGKALSDKKANNQSNLENSVAEISGMASSTATSTITNVSDVRSGNNNNAVAIGGQRDGNGCLAGAGYSWDSEIGSCIRAWEKLTTFIPTKKWYVVQNNKVFSKNIFFVLDQNSKISGKVCNSFSGTMKFDNKLNTVTSGSIMSTAMACLDVDVSNLEAKLFRVMSGIAEVSLNTDTGRLTLKKGNDVIEFTTNENEGAATVGVSDSSGDTVSNTPSNPFAYTSSQCVKRGGQWSAEFKECTGV